MLPSQLIDYELIEIPHKEVSLSQIDKIKKELKDLAQDYLGSPVIIPNGNLPLWYYFLLFNTLLRECPEIVYEINKDKQILLYTMYSEKHNYIRPLKIIVRHDITDFSKKTMRKVVKLNFNLSKLDKHNIDNMNELISCIENEANYCDELNLSGDTEIHKGLIAYAILNNLTNTAVYQINKKTINI